MSGKYTRDRGARYEREVVNEAKAFGLDAKRVPLSGAAEGFKGDVLIEANGVTYQCELKRRKKLSSYLTDYLADNDAVIVREDNGRSMVIMPLKGWLEQLGGSNGSD